MLIEDVNTANIEHMQFGFGWSGYSTGAFTIGEHKWSRSAETSKPPRLIAETHRHSSGKQELPTCENGTKQRFIVVLRFLER